MNNQKKSSRTIDSLEQQSINTDQVKGGNVGSQKEAIAARRNIPNPSPDCGLPLHGSSSGGPNVREGKKR